MRCVIIGAGKICNYDLISKYIKTGDFIIACDGGLYHTEKMKLIPNLIIGDFDSHSKPNTDIETIILPCEKDDTDTVFAIKEALKRGFDDFILLGVTGDRLDHTLVNLYALFMIMQSGAKGIIADDNCEITTIGKRPVKITDFKYFSLLNLTGKANGVNISGAKYNLNNAVITPFYQYATSNEITDTAEVSVDDGYLLLIKNRTV